MAVKLKKTYSFAFLTALYLALLAAIVSAISYFLYDAMGPLAAALGVVVFFITSFLVIQYRVEYFIYRRVRKI